MHAVTTRAKARRAPAKRRASPAAATKPTIPAEPAREQEPDDERSDEELRRNGGAERQAGESRVVAKAPGERDEEDEDDRQVPVVEAVHDDRRGHCEHVAAPVAQPDDPHRRDDAGREEEEPEPRGERYGQQREWDRREDEDRRVHGGV